MFLNQLTTKIKLGFLYIFCILGAGGQTAGSAGEGEGAEGPGAPAPGEEQDGGYHEGRRYPFQEFFISHVALKTPVY